jgi:hypothetical protein
MSNAFDQRYAGEMFDQPGAPPPGWAPQQPTPGLPASPPGIAAPSPASAYHGPGQVDPAGPHGNLTGSGGISALGPGAGSALAPQNPMEGIGQAWAAADASQQEAQSRLTETEMSGASAFERNAGLPPPPRGGAALEPAPKSTLGQNIGGWLTAALAAATFGAFVGRTHAVNALTAFGGTIEGLKSGNEEQFKQQSEAWEKSARAWEAQNKKMLDDYRLELENKKYSNQQRLQALQMKAQVYKDQMMYEQAQKGDIIAIARLQDARQKSQDEMKERHDEFEQHEKDRVAQIERQERQFQERQELSRQRLDMQQSPELAGEKSYQRTAGSQAARIESASNEVTQLAPLALAASASLPRGQFVPLNRLQQMGAEATSNPQYNDFIVKNASLARAFGRAMNPQGVPRVSEAQESKALGVLNSAISPKAYQVQVGALLQEVEASKQAVAATRNETALGGNAAPAGGVLRYDAQGNPI